MDITLQPGKLSGAVTAPPSKSMAHRMLICAAFSDMPTELVCRQTSDDITATAEALRQICHFIAKTDYGYEICPCGYESDPGPYSLWIRCNESGSTLRFLLPIAGALGMEATFELEGRLPQRPLSPLWEEMERMGCKLFWESDNILHCSGKLKPGHYCIDGSVSSQFITGLLFALSLLDGESKLTITGKTESKPYISMTEKAMALFSAPQYRTPGTISVEGDWSNGAFWLTAKQLDSDLTVTGLEEASPQGDRAVADILPRLEDGNPTISAADIPDLVPILAVAASAKNGAVFTDIRRLRIKESDRVASVIAMLTALGGKAEADENTLTVHPARLTGGTVDACNDHRIAMANAIASTVCTCPVTVLGAQCVQKSYPQFWEEFKHLGGNYELNLR
jgi:3-phosphoshikimate 1-carboxyvinyltransferase